MNKNLYIHGLRGAMALGVFFFHIAFSGLPTFSGFFYQKINQGVLSLEFCVEIFFGISGIVIVTSFRKSAGIANFIVDRVSRIYPVLWASVIVTAILLYLNAPAKYDIGVLVFIGNLLGLPPLVPIQLINRAAWTICCELIFYSAFVAFWFISKKTNRNAAIFFVAVFGIYFFTQSLRVIPFVIGIASLYAVENKMRLATDFKYAGFAIMGALLCWYFSMEISGKNNTFATLYEHPDAAFLFLAAIVLCFFGLSGVIAGNGYLCKLLISRPLQWLGTISFSLYMWQSVFMGITKKMLYVTGLATTSGPWAQIVFLLLALPPTLLASKISQIYLEGHATRSLRSYAKTRMASRPLEQAAGLNE